MAIIADVTVLISEKSPLLDMANTSSSSCFSSSANKSDDGELPTDFNQNEVDVPSTQHIASQPPVYERRQAQVAVELGLDHTNTQHIASQPPVYERRQAQVGVELGLDQPNTQPTPNNRRTLRLKSLLACIGWILLALVLAVGTLHFSIQRRKDLKNENQHQNITRSLI